MKCKVCGKRFKARKENKYLAAETAGLVNVIQPVKIYECFDCPACGCQNFVNIRMDAIAELNRRIDNG